MMYGVVMKITENRIVVLCVDGKFRNLPLPPFVPKLGERIAVPDRILTVPKRKQAFFPKKGWMAASFIGLCITLSWLFTAIGISSKPIAMVAIDINPSVALFVDANKKVQEVSLINDDAKWMLSEEQLIDVNFYDAVNIIISEAEQQGFLSANLDKKVVMMSVVNFESTSFIVNTAKISSDQGYLVKLNYSDKVQKQKADEIGLTLNKFLVYKQAEEMGILLNVEKLRKNSIVNSLIHAGWDPESFFKQEATRLKNDTEDTKTNEEHKDIQPEDIPRTKHIDQQVQQPQKNEIKEQREDNDREERQREHIAYEDEIEQRLDDVKKEDMDDRKILRKDDEEEDEVNKEVVENNDHEDQEQEEQGKEDAEDEEFELEEKKDAEDKESGVKEESSEDERDEDDSEQDD